jgi:hypothetical protein
MIRVPISPSTTKVKNFKVFVSYRSNQLTFASRCRDALIDLGFDVIMIEPSQYKMYATNEELLKALRAKVRKADAICILVSNDIESSMYLQAEIDEAARLIGRILFLYDGSSQFPAQFNFKSPGPRQLDVEIVVRWSILGIHEWNMTSRQELGVEILNDPDEGWFADTHDRLAWWLNRDVCTESSLRKYVRACLMVDPKCRGMRIREVLPILPSWNPPDNRDLLFKWYAEVFGRRSLLQPLRDGECNGMVVQYPITKDIIAPNGGDNSVIALYLREAAQDFEK